MRVLVLFGVVTTLMLGQTVPIFEDYPITEIYSGPVASPQIVKPEERRFQTAILQGVRKGYGVVDEPSGKERPGPNFAGRYIIVQWGCGSNCLQYAIVDAKLGTIHCPPVPGTHIAYFDSGLLDYRLRSRLMGVKTNCDLGSAERCDRDFYLWENTKFVHIFRLPRIEK